MPSCDRPVLAIGLCSAHYARQRTTGSVQADKPIRSHAPGSRCRVKGCTKAVAAHGVCGTHYARLRRWGDPEARYQPTGHTNRRGYRLAYAPDHPMAMRNGHVLEHRLVMAEALGRVLLPTETVHHKNGDKLNNRLTNLELWVKSQPAGQRAADLVRWAREIEALYGADYDKGLL